MANGTIRNNNDKIVRRNLLDNWYFAGGGSQNGDGIFPINQRGQAAYSGAGYSIDRWELGAGSGITIYSNYVELKSIASSSRRFRQTLTLPAGKYTFSCLLASGSNNNGSADVNGVSITLKEGTLTSYTVTHAGGSFSISLSSGAEGKKINIIACKLELGSYQTLAHNEGTEANPNWVLNELPDYSEELAKCQRYLLVLNPKSETWHSFAVGYSYDVTLAFILLATPVSMAKLPNITYTGIPMVQNGDNRVDVSSISGYSLEANSIMLRVETASNMRTSGTIYTLGYRDTNIGKIFLSAEEI